MIATACERGVPVQDGMAMRPYAVLQALHWFSQVIGDTWESS